MFILQPAFLLGLTALQLLNLCAANPNCTDLVIPITATATNPVIPIPTTLNTSDSGALSAFIQTIIGDADATYPGVPTGGTFRISARYCEPQVSIASRHNTVQLLVHGVTENKLYWSGLSYPVGYNGDTYSWIAYASSHGYPTLSIDRIGNGNSTHPDPILQQQVPLEEAILHQLVLKLKSGAAVPNRSFNKVIFVGHSYGSVLGNEMATNHPTDIAAFVLTGFGVSIIPVALDLPQTALFPAFLYAPRFAGFNPGYLVTSSKLGRRGYLWGAPGSFDDGIFLMDYNNEDVVGVGELLSIAGGLKLAPAYTGPVFVVTGSNDDVFCEAAQCGTGSASPQAMSGALFPKSSNFSYSEPIGTGHMINLHYTAQQSFKASHDFLAANGF